MPTVMTHAVVAWGMGHAFTGQKMPLHFWAVTVGVSILPDLDVQAFRFGIPYGATWGHRGFSHSLGFALLAGLAASLVMCRFVPVRWQDLWGFFFVVTASHGMLDAFTDGGLGVAFFSPIDTTRYFFPWRPIRVSALGLGFFKYGGWATLWSEIVWVWLPTVTLVGAVAGYRWFGSVRET